MSEEITRVSFSLVRFCYGPEATFGKMSVNGEWLYTVERPWINNLPYISCIPEGLYVCKERYFYKGRYKAFEVTYVENRTHILIHIANRARDVNGCIGLGDSLGCVDGEWAVMNSTTTFNRFAAHVREELRRFKQDQFLLYIVNSFKGSKHERSIVQTVSEGAENQEHSAFDHSSDGP